jgi:hypothetical protein
MVGLVELLVLSNSAMLGFSGETTRVGGNYIKLVEKSTIFFIARGGNGSKIRVNIAETFHFLPI